MDDGLWLRELIEKQGVAVAFFVWAITFFSFRVWPAIERAGTAVLPVLERIATSLETGVKAVNRLSLIQERRQASQYPPIIDDDS